MLSMSGISVDVTSRFDPIWLMSWLCLALSYNCAELILRPPILRCEKSILSLFHSIALLKLFDTVL